LGGEEEIPENSRGCAGYGTAPGLKSSPSAVGEAIRREYAVGIDVLVGFDDGAVLGDSKQSVISGGDNRREAGGCYERAAVSLPGNARQ